jgi:hypothetical protein
MGIPDGVNSLVFTIIRHFIGTPSNITSLPNLFAHKIRTVLSNSNEIIDYDTLTYGDIISTIKQEGLKMCIEQRIAKQ